MKGFGPRHPLALLELLALIPAVAACVATGDAPAARMHLDTVAGVVHALNMGDGAWTAGTRWQVDTSRAVKIGSVDGVEPYLFGVVAGVVVGDDGRIYVADSQAKEIRVFSGKGEFLTRFGREGEGPGEFSNISGLGRGPGGGVAALDGQLGRVSVFDADGGFMRSFRLQRPYMILMNGWPVRFDDRGRYYDRTQLSHGIGPDTMGIVRYAADGQVQDTTLVAVHTPVRWAVSRDGKPTMTFTVPYAATPASIVGPNGRIYSTTGETYAIARLDVGGDTVLVMQRDLPAETVTAAERDSALAGLRRLYHQMVGTDPREMPSIPATKPAIYSLRVDEDGYLWVLNSSTADSPALDWDVFDLQGRFLGTLALPLMNVMDIGAHTIAGVVKDAMGVAQVEVVPLVRGTGGS